MAGMQDRTIKKRLAKKLSDWTDTINDRDLQKAIHRDVIVTGGSIASMAMGDPINDFDVYFRTRETAKKVAEYYVDEFIRTNGHDAGMFCVRDEEMENIKGETENRVVIFIQSSGTAASEEAELEEDGEEYSGDPTTEFETDEADTRPKYRPIFLSENAITLSHSMQLVIRFWGEPDQIHRNYDFVHAKCYYDWYNGVLSMPVEAIRSMQSKTLRYEGSLYPICSLFRLRKFIKRGWTISAGDILKIAWQVSEINLKDARVLREQLTGVDALYFRHLIEALESDQAVLDSTYVATIIDRIFHGD